MATGDVKQAFAASSALTQTNLDGVASSATWVAGWGSATIDNSANLYLDYAVNAVLQVESAGLAAGEIRMYFCAELNDSAYPNVLSAGTMGTEGAVTITDTEQRDASFRLAASCQTDTGASEFYTLMCPSVAAAFGGACPRKFMVFITQSSGAALETTGDPNQVYVRGQYLTIA